MYIVLLLLFLILILKAYISPKSRKKWEDKSYMYIIARSSKPLTLLKPSNISAKYGKIAARITLTILYNDSQP